MRAAAAALLLGSALLTGCAGGPGAFCTRDSECRTGLRCYSSNAGRGVCTYPGTPSERDGSAKDARALDGRREQPRLDARPETRPVEARPAEARPADASPADARPADLSTGDRPGQS